MASNKRTIYLGLDYSNFTGGVTEVNRKMGLLDAEFKRATQEAKNYGTETDQLALKSDYLTQKIALQNQKVEAAKEAYDKAMASNQASQKEIDELDKRLLNERTALEKLNGQLIETQRETSGLDEANEKLNKSFKSLVAGAVAVVGALTKFAIDAANTADDLKTLSAQTGMTTTEIQRLQYASEFVDVSFDTMSASITKLGTNMDKARDGSKDLNEAFRKLHIRIKDGNGQLRDQTEVFYEVIDKLKNIKNETERDVLANELFGKSFKELKPLVEAGTDKLRELGDEAERTGKIMSEEDVEAGADMADSMARLNATITAVKNSLGKALMPVLESLSDILSEIDPETLAIISVVGLAVTLVYKLVGAIAALSVSMAAHTGVQMVFNAVSLKSIGIILAIVAGLVLLGVVIATIMGRTDDLTTKMDEATKKSSQMGQTIQGIANTTNTASKHASGTDYYQGGKTWVGEEGPELVDLPRGSKIYNAKKSAQMVGAGTQNYYITIDAKNVQDFQRVVEMANSMQMATRRI